MVTVRYCQSNSFVSYGFDLIEGWRMGDAAGERYFLEKRWSSLERGRFFGWKVSYFLFGYKNCDFSYMKVDWVRS